MARELGMNPEKFGSLGNHRQEPAKQARAARAGRWTSWASSRVPEGAHTNSKHDAISKIDASRRNVHRHPNQEIYALSVMATSALPSGGLQLRLSLDGFAAARDGALDGFIR
jgi:hypothetical protein